MSEAAFALTTADIPYADRDRSGILHWCCSDRRHCGNLSPTRRSRRSPAENQAVVISYVTYMSRFRRTSAKPSSPSILFYQTLVAAAGGAVRADIAEVGTGAAAGVTLSSQIARTDGETVQ